MRKTKIVCTLGPATYTRQAIEKLVDAGANVFRLNFSHGTHEEHGRIIQTIKEIRKERKISLGILLDTKGPEVRVGDIEDLSLNQGDRVDLVETVHADREIPVNPPSILDAVDVGANILFDDGYIASKVVGKSQGRLTVEIENRGILKRHKGINIPDANFSFPLVTEQDIADIRFGCEMGIEMIAASFVCEASQVLQIREILQSMGKADVLVLAKIESSRGVRNFAPILEVADGIMVARGDLGVEMDIARVPRLQKMMIRECNLRAKISITATQMLESMIRAPRPTRAEVSDVANAIYDATSAVMLSGETAVGSYPVEVVNTMSRIVREAEEDMDYREYFYKQQIHHVDVASAMSRAAVATSYDAQASAILVCSRSGNTLLRVTRYRPRSQVILLTPSDTTYQQASIMWGTQALHESGRTVQDDFYSISCQMLQKNWVKYGDLIVVTTGKPYGISYTTNSLTVRSVGDVILRGKCLLKEDIASVTAEITSYMDPTITLHAKDKIVLLSRCQKEDMEKLIGAKGVILQNHPTDHKSEEYLLELYEKHRIPSIVQADGASYILSKYSSVRLHPSLGLVFSVDSPTKEDMEHFECPLQQ